MGCVISCTFSLLFLTFSAWAQDLDAILALNAAAQGGDRLAQVTSIRHRLSIKEPGFEVAGTYVASRAGAVRFTRMSIPPR